MFLIGLTPCSWHQFPFEAFRSDKSRFYTICHLELSLYFSVLVTHSTLTTSRLSRAGAPAMPVASDFRSSARHLTFIAFLSWMLRRFRWAIVLKFMSFALASSSFLSTIIQADFSQNWHGWLACWSACLRRSICGRLCIHLHLSASLNRHLVNSFLQEHEVWLPFERRAPLPNTSCYLARLIRTRCVLGSLSIASRWPQRLTFHLSSTSSTLSLDQALQFFLWLLP